MKVIRIYWILIVGSVAGTVHDLCHTIQQGTSWLDHEDKDCKSFYTCRFNLVVRFECAFGATFDQEAGSCSFHGDVECQDYDMSLISCTDEMEGLFPHVPTCTCHLHLHVLKVRLSTF